MAQESGLFIDRDKYHNTYGRYMPNSSIGNLDSQRDSETNTRSLGTPLTNATSITSSLERPLKIVSRVSVLLYGLGLVLSSLGLFVLYGYFGFQASEPSSVVAYVSVSIAAYVFLLVAGAFLIKVGMGVGRGVIPKKSSLLAVIMFSLFTILDGAALLVINQFAPSSPIEDAGILYITAGILMIPAVFIYRGTSTTSKITGSTLGIVSIALVISAINSISSVGNLGFGFFVSGLASAIGGVGSPLDAYYPLAEIGFIIALVAALMYPILRKTKLSSISSLIAVVGILLFGIATVITTLSFVTGSIWSAVPFGYYVTYIVANIFLAIAGFLVLAACGVGIAFFSKDIMTSIASPVAISAGQLTVPAPASVASGDRFCSNCGNGLKPGSLFCGKCGTKQA